jgi:DNA modification methylase
MTTIKDLKFDGKNFNKHTEFGMSLLEKSLRENGAGRSILIDKDNNIIAGNGVVETAGNIGLDDIQIVESDGSKIIAVKRTDISLNSHKGREMALADNATAAVDLDWDDEAIKSEFTEEETKGWGVDLDWKDVEEITEDEAPELNENEPADSELGKVYQLGEHRLMCGDSTDAGSVAILMDGQKADMVFTDPPYGMNLDTDWSSAHGAFGHGLKHDKVIGDNDDFTPDLIKTVFDNFGYCKEIFMWGCDYYAELIENRNLGSIIVWDKSIDEKADKMFGSNFELCWSKNRHKRELARVKWKSIFGVADDQKSRVHPTQKPAALALWFFKKYGGKDDTVVDLYGGSGSTLIACEQLGRKCYMMELDPKYCDVIRKRYWKFKTGSEEGWQDGTKAIREA